MSIETPSDPTQNVVNNVTVPDDLVGEVVIGPQDPKPAEINGDGSSVYNALHKPIAVPIVTQPSTPAPSESETIN